MLFITFFNLNITRDYCLRYSLNFDYTFYSVSIIPVPNLGMSNKKIKYRMKMKFKMKMNRFELLC